MIIQRNIGLTLTTCPICKNEIEYDQNNLKSLKIPTFQSKESSITIN